MVGDSHKVQWAAVVVAAGEGSRCGLDEPKQYHKMNFAEGYEAVLAQSVRRLLPFVDVVQTVIGDSHEEFYRNSMEHLASDKIAPPVFGGATRQASVYQGLSGLAEQSPQFVMIHDAARPYVSDEIISAVQAKTENDGGAVPVIHASDSVCLAEDARVLDYLERAKLALVQTPQAFLYQDIWQAHQAAADSDGLAYDDDAALAMAHGVKVGTVSGADSNIKLTQASDFAERQLFESRTASAFDVHGLGAGNEVRLCGVSLPHSQALEGHSDADVALHALCDAMLAVAGEADIGHHFPPSDPKWQGADSEQFVRFALDKLQARAMHISFADISLICEAPKIAPHRPAMIGNLARMLGLREEQIAVKATTTEKLGFLGRGEGIAAWATVTVRVPYNG